jgi:hypothetical protein
MESNFTRPKTQLSQNFANIMSKESFEGLLVILNWSWNFFLSLIDSPVNGTKMKNLWFV